jgi:hypothetical protein
MHPRNDFRETELEQVLELYRLRPNAETGNQLTQMLAAYLIRHGGSGFGPFLGIMEVLLERKHVGTSRSFVRRAIGTGFVKLGVRICRRKMEKIPSRPGWNDYWMARWQLTKENRAAEEIHRRVEHVSGPEGSDWYYVNLTARWMARSQAEFNPEFAAAMDAAWIACPRCQAGSQVTSHQSPLTGFST